MSKIEHLDLDTVNQIILVAKEFDDSGGDELDLDEAPREALWRIQAIADAAKPVLDKSGEPEAESATLSPIPEPVPEPSVPLPVAEPETSPEPVPAVPEAESESAPDPVPEATPEVPDREPEPGAE